jgi:hypothetical protein
LPFYFFLGAHASKSARTCRSTEADKAWRL